MIVKVKAPGRFNGWRFYDGARDVQTCTGTKRDLVSHALIEGGTPEGVQEDWFEEDLHPDCTYTLVSFLGPDSSMHHVYANTQAYLMTDDGKTIERVI